MPRFVKMLATGMKERGHLVEILEPKEKLSKLALTRPLKKWFGYVDQFVIFPFEVRRILKRCPADTLFVFTDHALGPWVPLVTNRFHVIHCHDFLAQLSALGEIHENITGWTGKLYQSYIRRGYTKGKNFVSVSKKTQKDLHHFLSSPPAMSKVVYNGLNRSFSTYCKDEARDLFSKKLKERMDSGYILHVGGNTWYKNRLGVIEIYKSFRSKYPQSNLPLLLIGEGPTTDLMRAFNMSSFKTDIFFLNNVDDETLNLACAGANVFLFPSLAEGFGWPIVEAMACGCPVITTNETPMTEVAGTAGFYIPRRPYDQDKVSAWANEAARIVDKVTNLTGEERERIVEAGILNARKFDNGSSIDQIEVIYHSILNS